MTSTPWDGWFSRGENHILSMRWSFPSDAVIVRARGRHKHERWVLMKPESEDMWNLWMVWNQHCTDGCWLVLDIVPWWGTWSEQYEGSTPSEEVDILPPAEADPVEMPHAEAEPVECQTRCVRFTIDCEV